jgi:ABC-type sugar transport system ATPase subunit
VNPGTKPAPLSDGGAITLRGLSKSYGNTRALQGLDLDLASGEILGIAGPNGAGKSTLIRILAGEEEADAGQISNDDGRCTREFLAKHVAVVHQEPQLFPNLTVAENLLVGRERTRFLRPRIRRVDRDLMSTMGILAQSSDAVSRVRLATRQRVEIGRALARNARIFLFDEPNSALSADESRDLFRELHRVSEAGNIVILVTHRLDDLVRHTRRVALIRDGRVDGQLTGAGLTEEAIARLLVQGLEPDEKNHDAAARTQKHPGEPPLLQVRSWHHTAKAFSNVEFALASGEVVAVLGVEGSGAREVLRSIAGFEKARGDIRLRGREGATQLRAATAYVAPSRTESLFHNLTVGDNILARLGRPEIANIFGQLKKSEMRSRADAEIRHFWVKAESASHSITTLSGGNQQKVAIAQAILKRPQIILLEEPTRGVDIGSTREIYELLRDFAANGAGVLMFCTEILEVFEAADRVLVFVQGRLAASIATADHERIEELAATVARAAGEAM